MLLKGLGKGSFEPNFSADGYERPIFWKRFVICPFVSSTSLEIAPRGDSRMSRWVAPVLPTATLIILLVTPFNLQMRTVHAPFQNRRASVHPHDERKTDAQAKGCA